MDTIMDSSASSDGSFYYFAYGSNLLTERIRLMNPSAEFVSVGKVSDFALSFAGSSTGR